MKTKIIWEPKDIICGRIVCKPWENEFQPCGWKAKWTYKIGWLACSNPNKKYYPIKGKTEEERQKYIEENRADYCLIAMTDGMVSTPLTKRDLADRLNKECLIPMPQKQFLQIISYLEDLNTNGNG